MSTNNKRYIFYFSRKQKGVANELRKKEKQQATQCFVTIDGIEKEYTERCLVSSGNTCNWDDAICLGESTEPHCRYE